MRLSSSKRWKRGGEGQANPGAHAYMFVCTHRCFHTQTHTSTVNSVCLRQGAQVGKRGQSRQDVVGKVEGPVGGERDTLSGSHPSTLAQPQRMRVSSSKRWKGEGQAKELHEERVQRRKSAKKKECKVPPHSPRESKSENTGTQCVKRITDALPLGHMSNMTRYLCVPRTFFHTQASTWRCCGLCMLTARSSGRQTRLPAESASWCI
jgi:hypothetical protein